ncbi:uncharacterized protein KZ484_008650 [Pholidichthys leucotaenia]
MRAVKRMAKSIKEPGIFCCSICLDALKKPVTLHCGHSYCMDCVNGYWDQEDQSGVYSCPQCRHTFNPRPVLNTNTVLVGVMGEMSAATGEPTPGVQHEVGPGQVECDFCSVKKLKAVKSCLVCLASYCSTHLQPHYESAAFKRHKLVEVSVSLQDKICPKHDKLLEVYCRSDDQCICLLCVMDEHKGHDTISAAAERKEKQKLFGKKKQRYQQGIQEKEKQLRQLRQKIKAMQSSSDVAVDQNEKACTEIIQMVEKRCYAMNELIRNQKKAVVSRADALMDRLEKEISELRKQEDELKQLSLTEDHIHFLQHCHPIFDSDSEVLLDDSIQLHTTSDFATKAITDMKNKMEALANTIQEMCETIQLDLDPKTRNEFSMYCCSLRLDPNTAFENLLLSEGNSKVSWIKKAQAYTYHPERFTKYDQVLCTEGLSGVCYWEVEWRGPRVEVAMCYKGLELEESGFGYTNQSWCISLSNALCVFWHNGVRTKLSIPCSSTLGVYLNHKGGSLSFYSISDSGQMVLLHRVQTTFLHPLYPGFMVSKGASVKIITPHLELLDCAICLQLLEDPVTTACGHSYCIKCINYFWDKLDHGGSYSCPQCRQSFDKKPVLKRNIILAKVLEEHKKKTSQNGSAAAEWDSDTYAAPGDVPCDACTGRKRKAEKFCLVCLTSFCEAHLHPHLHVPPLQNHSLIQASARTKESICSLHDKLLVVYCRTDRQLLCLTCATNEHKGHDTVSVTTEKEEMKRQLEATELAISDRVLVSQRNITKLMDAKSSIRDAAWEACDDFERLCAEHVRQYVRAVERKCSEMRENVGEAEKAGVDWATSLLTQLQREVSDLRRRQSDLCQLSQNDDPIQFVQAGKALCDLPVFADSHRELGTLHEFVTAQKVKIKDMCNKEKKRLLFHPEESILVKKPRLNGINKRTELLERWKNSRLEVDPRTVARCLHLSGTKEEISWCDPNPPHPDHPDRFTFFPQALCTEGLWGDHYWEVEWDGGIVDVAVSYKGIQRKGSGKECYFGHNSLSWKLSCSPSGCTFWHNSLHKGQIPPVNSCRLGVRLDCEEGMLTFYSVSKAGELTLLHQTRTTFTEPVYPGFSLDLGATLKICNI